MNIDHPPQGAKAVSRLQQTLAVLRAERDDLQAANQRLELALAASGVVGLWDWMVHTDLLHGDSNFARLYGLDPKKTASGLTMEEYQKFVVLDDLPALRSDIRETFERGTDFFVEYRLAIPGQLLRWVECKGKLINDDDGKPYRFSGTAIDITDRKIADEKIRVHTIAARENAERVQLALQAGAIIGTWVWDIEKNDFAVDEGFANAFGLDSALGHHGISLEQVVETVHPDDKVGLAKAIEEAIENAGPYMYQYRVRRSDGAYYWVEANGRVERGASGLPQRFPGVLIDITSRRNVEAERDRVTSELRDLNMTLEQRVVERTSALVTVQETLRQSQKMEAVGQLTGGLAHDFNNLLAGITGALQLMEIRMKQGRFNDFERYIAMAQGSSKRAASLTHRLLAFSRQQTLTPKPTNVNRLVADMHELIQRTVGPSILVEVVAVSEAWTALVDGSQLENALLNLCINARDAMPDGGRITIETSNKWIDEHAGRAQSMEQGEYLALCVTDTGSGMSKEVIARAFDPFFTTKPIGQGTGLGLSMAYGFAQQSGGQVHIDSEVDKGTTLCIFLPRHHGDSVEEDKSSAVATLNRSEHVATVLIVDDEPTVRALLVDILEDMGYAWIEAEDSARGLKILQSDARIDLLVSDIGLPGGMNGHQMAEAGCVSRPDLKVLFITGYAENAVLSNGHLAPGMALLTKPFSIELIAERIRSMIDSSSLAFKEYKKL